MNESKYVQEKQVHAVHVAKIMKKAINYKIDTLKELTGLKLFADYASVYGGYRLVQLNEAGGHFGVFGQSSCCERVNAKSFNLYLDGLLGMYDYLTQSKINL